MISLILGKLYGAAAALPGKLDERLRAIAALVNGGLSADNLDPDYKLPLASFREHRSALVLTRRFRRTSPTFFIVEACQVPVACQLRKVIARVEINDADADRSGAVNLYVNGGSPIAQRTLAVPLPASGASYDVWDGGTLREAVFDLTAAPRELVAGDRVTVGLVLEDADHADGDVSFVLSFPHAG